MGIYAQLQLEHVATHGVGRRQGNHASLVKQVIVAARLGFCATAQVLALDVEGGSSQLGKVIGAAQVEDAPVVVHTMIVEVAEGLVVSRMAILQADVVVQRIVEQHELAGPTGIEIEVGERLFLLVPVIG